MNRQKRRYVMEELSIINSRPGFYTDLEIAAACDFVRSALTSDPPMSVLKEFFDVLHYVANRRYIGSIRLNAADFEERHSPKLIRCQHLALNYFLRVYDDHLEIVVVNEQKE